MASTVPSDVKNSAAAAAESKSPENGDLRKEQLTVLAACALLVALVLACYLRTLGSYFLADDFGEVSYVSHIWGGQWKDYWLDWVSNTQRLAGMAVYRPWFITTLVIDYGLWQGNAFGYYLTSVIYYTLDVLLLFAVGAKLTERSGRMESLLCGFFSAALFAVNALHCETVSWSGGRTDNICCTFFLSGLLLFLYGRGKPGKRFTAGALICFWFGMLTKEMAIALPVVVTAIAFLFPESNSQTRVSLKSRIVGTIKETYPYWVCTAIYFVVRYLALGTLGGGYTGGFSGESTALARVFDRDNYGRLLFPLAIGVFPQYGVLFKTLFAVYCASTLLIVYRLIRGQISWRYLGVLAAWFAATAVPIYQVWGLGLNLEGARYFFFLTIPLSLLFPILMFKTRQSGGPQASEKIPIVLAAAVLTAMVLVNFKIASRFNGNWVQAGKEVRACTHTAVELAKTKPATTHIAILGIPKNDAGAHMIYNGQSFLMAVDHPFFPQSYAGHFETFDPIMFGPDQFINSVRFKKAVLSTHSLPYVWSGGKRQWLPVVLESAGPADPLNLSEEQRSFNDIKVGNAVPLPVKNVNPLQYDFLELQYNLPSTDQARELTFTAKWTSASEAERAAGQSVAVYTEERPVRKEWQTVRIPVSHYWRWYAGGEITGLTLSLPAVARLDIREVRLVSDRNLRPVLTVDGASVNPTGVCSAGSGGTLVVDAANVPGAAKIQLECTKENFFFDSINMKDLTSALYRTRTVEAPRATVALDRNLCPAGGFCEVRVRALDAQNRVVGEYSEPVTVQLKP